MKQSKFTDQQIAFALKQAETGKYVKQLLAAISSHCEAAHAPEHDAFGFSAEAVIFGTMRTMQRKIPHHLQPMGYLKRGKG